eukprot:4855721-Amphidinium_carterae.2
MTGLPHGTHECVGRSVKGCWLIPAPACSGSQEKQKPARGRSLNEPHCASTLMWKHFRFFNKKSLQSGQLSSNRLLSLRRARLWCALAPQSSRLGSAGLLGSDK